MSTLSVLTATPKATADLVGTSSLLVLSISDSDGVHAALTSLAGTSSLVVIKDFGYSDLVGTSNLVSTGHHVTEMRGSLGSMTALLTSGYYNYASLIGSLPSLTVQASIGGTTNTFDYIAATFLPMVGNIISLVGQTTTASTQYLPPMTALLADKSYAAISGSLRSLAASSGNYPPLGSYAHLPFITLGVSGQGQGISPASAELDFPIFGITGNGGGYADMPILDLVLSGTGSHIDTGGGTLPFINMDVSGTGTGIGIGIGALSFVTLAALGYSGGGGTLPFASLSLSGAGERVQSGVGILPFIKMDVIGSASEGERGGGVLPFMALHTYWTYGELPFVKLMAKGRGRTYHA